MECQEFMVHTQTIEKVTQHLCVTPPYCETVHSFVGQAGHTGAGLLGSYWDGPVFHLDPIGTAKMRQEVRGQDQEAHGPGHEQGKEQSDVKYEQEYNSDVFNENKYQIWMIEDGKWKMEEETLPPHVSLYAASEANQSCPMRVRASLFPLVPPYLYFPTVRHGTPAPRHRKDSWLFIVWQVRPRLNLMAS